MSMIVDETAADVPVRDEPRNLCPPAAGAQDSVVHQNACHDISRISRKELEERFLCLYEEDLHHKRLINEQEDKIKKLATKLMKLVKDRGRIMQLATGANRPVPTVRIVELEEMNEELQEKFQGLQLENERLKRRLFAAQQQLVKPPSMRSTPYGHVQSRVKSGLKKLRDNASSPSPTQPPTFSRILEGGRRPPTGLLPRYGHSLLEDARAEIRSLENEIESQRAQMEEMEQATELLQEKLRKKEAEYEENLLHIRQQQISKMSSHVNNNVSMIRLQKQLQDRANAITELEGRYLQLQECQKKLLASHNAAMVKVDELWSQLKEERMKNLDLGNQLQSSAISKKTVEQLRERILEVEQERDILKESNDRLLSSAFDISHQQKWNLQEMQLKSQITQLETALKAELVDKNEILNILTAERDRTKKLTEENQQLLIQSFEQKQKVEELNDRLKRSNKENEHDAAELTEALLLIKERKAQKSGKLDFLNEVEYSNIDKERTIKELRAAHAETIQELQKTRKLLDIESKINKDYKVEVETVLRKRGSDKMEYEQKLKHQTQLLEMKDIKIKKLQAQLKDIAYGTRTNVFKPDFTDEDEADKFPERLDLEDGENLMELQIVSATLSPSALEALGDCELTTFCTYRFFFFDWHSTPVVTGPKPEYGYTSQYIVSMDEQFLSYLSSSCVTVELHQAMGLEWRMLATGQLHLQQLLKQDGKIPGTVPLVGMFDEVQSFGSVDYWMRMRFPMKEMVQLYQEKVKTKRCISNSLTEDGAVTRPLPPNISWNGLDITVQSCHGLQSKSFQQPSPYVIYKFFDFPDYPTATVHNSSDPQFKNHKSFSVLMDAKLDQYLKSEVLQFYVFDEKEEQIDTYLGKTRVPLLPLAQDGGISGLFELADPSGQHAGHIEVTLKWKFPYSFLLDSVTSAEKHKFIPKQNPTEESVETTHVKYNIDEEKKAKERNNKDVEETLQKEKENKEHLHPSTSLFDITASKAPLPKLRQKKKVKERPAAKKVTFGDLRAADSQLVSGESLTPQSITEEEDVEEQSQFSEGQLVSASSQSCSDDSEISEDLSPDVKEVSEVKEDRRESMQSDSDDCIVFGQATGRKASERIRVEIVSLSLRPESRVAQDSSVVCLFVEYSFLDLPTEETPLSLPKPQQGNSINYNYSKVIPVDVEHNGTRRQLLKTILQGHNPQMERIRFTVVSEPPEEEEQDRECEDVGVAFLRIPEILEKQQDLTETHVNILDLEDSSVVVGSLTVSVEGLEALQSIMGDPDQE